jgi:hypothetical protein
VKREKAQGNLRKALHLVLWKTIELNENADPYKLATGLLNALESNFCIEIREQNYLDNYGRDKGEEVS